MLKKKNAYSKRWQYIANETRKFQRFCPDPYKIHQAPFVAVSEVHHIRGLKNHPEDLHNLDEIIGLCRSCHKLTEHFVRYGVDTVELMYKTKHKHTEYLQQLETEINEQTKSKY